MISSISATLDWEEELVERGGQEKGASVCLFSVSPLDKVDKVKSLDRAFAHTERTDNRQGIAAVNLARENVP